MMILGVLLGLVFSNVEAKRNTTELLRVYNLPSQGFDVTTRDGYILTIFRVPRPGRTPVLIMPGFISSSNTWVVGPPNQNYVVELAKEYDVWLLNYRGGYYGKRHRTLDPVRNARQFWDFSVHELGTIDLPDLIDFVERRTGRSRMLYMAHSMGSLMMYIMCVEVPSHCNKLQAAGLLAPVIFPPSRVDQALLRNGIRSFRTLASTLRRMGMHEFLGDDRSRFASVESMCRMPIIGESLCAVGLTIPFPGMTANVDRNTLPTYIIKTLSGTSVKLAEHMTRVVTSNEGVPKYEERGLINNIISRGTTEYYSGNVSIPLIVFHSTSDPFTDVESIDKLKAVSNVVFDKLITDRTFNHLNFIFSNFVREYILNDLLPLFRRYART